MIMRQRSMRQSVFLVLALVNSLSLLSGCGGGGGIDTSTTSVAKPPKPTASAPAPTNFQAISASSCTLPGDGNAYGGGIHLGSEYYVAQNIFYMPDLTGVTQCISGTTVSDNGVTQTGVTGLFTWNYPRLGSGFAYPEIIFAPGGLNPAMKLPEIGSTFSMSHDFVLTDSSNDAAVFYDIWVSEATGRQVAEIGLSLQNPRTLDPKTLEHKDVTIGDHVYDVYSQSATGLASGRTWLAITLMPKGAIAKGTISLKPVVDYLISQSYLNTTNIISGIDFGVEITGGSGSLTINSYSVTQ